METLKIVLVIGLGASAVAIGLAYLMSIFHGSTVSGDEIFRYVVISFVVTATALVTVRRRLKN